MKIKASLILPSINDLMLQTGLNEGGKVQQYIDNFVFTHSEPSKSCLDFHFSSAEFENITS